MPERIMDFVPANEAPQRIMDFQPLEEVRSTGIPAKPSPGLARRIWEYPTTPTEKPTGVLDFLSRVMAESAAKQGIGMVRFPVDVAQSVASPERGEKFKEMGKGALRFVGEPVGAYGLKQMKERWATDPVGSFLAISPFVKYGLRRLPGVKSTSSFSEAEAGLTPTQKLQKRIAVKDIETGKIYQTEGKTHGDLISENNLQEKVSREKVHSGWMVDDKFYHSPREAIEALTPKEPSWIQKAWNWYLGSGVPEQTPYRGVIKDYLATEEVIPREVRAKTAELLKVVPKRSTREAMVNYSEAGGNLETLKTWAATAEPKYRAGYEDALKLTDQEKGIVKGHEENMDRLGQMAVKEGLLEGLLENFVHRVWNEESPSFATRLRGAFDSTNWREFATNPSLIRQRIFETSHEAERLGYRWKNKDIAWLDAAYEQSLLRAINSRAAVKRLFETKAKDGRPLVAIEGSGKAIPPGENAEAVLVKPYARPEELRSYKRIEHPALKKWKWLSSVEHPPDFFPGERESLPGSKMAMEKIQPEATPIFMQGDAVVHPEIYTHMKNLLTRSAVRESEWGRAALKGVLGLKQTLLSFSGFHQVQVSIHGIFHRVAPWNLPEVDMNNPIQKGLVRGGVTLGGGDFRELFQEGLSSGGIVHKIPGIGPFLQKYTDYLFESFIPRLKMKMGMAALERNRERYGGRISEDQLFEMTARQANVAFGELNYKLMGRSSTTQDVLRLMFLAPDFLEARARFAGQAMKPWGGEQATALLIGALGMYIPARIVNSLIDGDPHFEKPFSIIIPLAGGKREFTVRSVPGDMLHLLEAWQSFIYYRLSPGTRAGMEMLYGRNMYGQRVLAADQVKDVLRNAIPIPFQTFARPTGAQLPWWESFLRSVGISSWPYRSTAEQEALKVLSDRMPKGALKESEREKRQARRDLIDALRTKGEVPKSLREAVQKGAVKYEDMPRIFKESGMTNLEATFHRLSLDEALHVMGYATREEKRLLFPILQDKVQRALAAGKMTPELVGQLGELSL